MTTIEGLRVLQAIKDGTQSPPAGIVTLGLDRGSSWLKSFSPGHVTAIWDVDAAYRNLEGATIAAWLACLADQMAFYAACTVLDSGATSRMLDLRLTCHRPVLAGRLDMLAEVEVTTPGVIWARTKFRLDSGELAVTSTAMMSVVASG